MSYYVARNGQTYGPYALETIQKYLSEGSLHAADMARTEDMSSWTPLGQLVNASVTPVTGSMTAAASMPLSSAPLSPMPAGSMPVPPVSALPPMGTSPPPSLHWAIVFLLNMVTGGIFVLIWVFVQSAWVRTIDPTSKATRDYILGFIIGMGGVVMCAAVLIVSVGVNALANGDITPAVLGGVGTAFFVFLCFMIVAVIFHMKAVFGIRDSLVRYYNTVEPINLRLSAIMTFFFNIFYFQYHFTRIAEWKRTGVLQPQQ